MADLLDKIKEAEQMLGNEEQAIEIAKLMNLRNFDEEKLTASSPFSSDSNPSFIWNKKDLCYHDFSNGGNYSIINAYMYAYDETYAQALKRLFDRCHIEFDFKRGFGYDERESLENYKFPVDDSVEDNSNAIAYLKKRGFTEETIKFFDIGQTKKGDVQFKFKDINGRLVGVKYRHARSIKKGESKYWWQSDCSTCHFLFNMDKVDITKPLVITEGNCFPGDAQILTKHGWVNFEDYDNEEVMQVNPDGTSSFVMPLAKVVHEYDGKMVEASQNGRYYTFTTEEHNLVLRSKNGFVKKSAKDMPDSINPKYTNIPVCAEYNDGKGIPFSDDEIRLFVAFSADGSYNKESCYEKREVNRIRFGFSKKRKFDRLKTILENLGIKYTETVKPSEKYATGTSYYIGFTDENAFLKKNFDWTWLSDMTKHQREVLLEEVCYWDGYRFDSNNIVNTRNIGEYYSTIKNNAEFIQAMCHISGFMATIVYRKDPCDNHSTAMSVHMLYSKDNVSWQKMWSTGKAKKADYKGMVYCVTVPSGMILVRQKEKISVSGNCDAMAVWQSGSHNVVSIPGGATDLNWIKYNFDFLEKFKKIILWLDNDTAGEEGTKKIVQKLGEYRCYIVESPDYAQEAVEEYYKQFNQEKPIRKTDANNVMIAIDGSAVLKMIADAKAVENPRVKHLFDYEEMQLQNVPNISFGIKALNKVLYGNFQNTLTLITGTAGCVDCDTEFFTGTDWKRIADFQDGDKVLQYNEDGTTSLVYPSIYHKYPCDKMWHFETAKLDQCLSDEHTVVYYDKGRNLRTKSFAEVREIHNKNVYGFRGKFIRSFKYNGEGIDLTDAEIKLMCAVICDGCFHSSKKDSNAVVISVKKERKKNKVREILKECAIDYHETVNTKGYTNFYFYAPRHEKEFTDYWYNCSQHQLQVICDNILFWDGHVYNNGAKVFFTSVERTATFIQFAFVSTGHYASLNIYDRRGTEKETNGKIYTRNSLEYTVQISDQVLVGISGASNSVNGKKAEITEYKTKDGFKYCFTVPSHMWVMRRNRKIVVSGNCGKSSVLNQIGVAAPLEQNRNVFIYSGEIPAQFLLGNIFRPMASNRHIIEFDNGADRPKGYAVSKQATDLIRQCYHENLYVYDDCFEGDNSLSTEGTGLLKQMDYSYRRYGTDVYIIDNLMTIDLKGCTGETKFEKQIDFIKQLKMFTRKYPVEVFLVAHSRKLAQGETEVGLQSVAGASEISNLADRCIACKILNEDSEGYDFQLSVVKDRQSGKAGSKLKLYYDNCSMRIFSDEQELNMRYRWERELGNKIHYDDNLSKRIVANIPELKFNPVPTFTSEPDIPTESAQEPNLPF